MTESNIKHKAYSIIETMAVRTTVLLNEEIYAILVKTFGKRRISEGINKLLTSKLFKPKKSMFGTLPKMDLSDLETPDEEWEQ